MKNVPKPATSPLLYELKRNSIRFNRFIIVSAALVFLWGCHKNRADHNSAAAPVVPNSSGAENTSSQPSSDASAPPIIESTDDTESQPIPLSEDTKLVEEIILGLHRPRSMFSNELGELLLDSTRFEKKGHFYKVLGEFWIFGCKATYIGDEGIDLMPGPNATVIGTPQEVSDYIGRVYSMEFQNINGNFMSQMSQHVRLYISLHPKRPEETMVIAAYLGP